MSETNGLTMLVQPPKGILIIMTEIRKLQPLFYSSTFMQRPAERRGSLQALQNQSFAFRVKHEGHVFYQYSSKFKGIIH